MKKKNYIKYKFVLKIKKSWLRFSFYVCLWNVTQFILKCISIIQNPENVHIQILQII